MRIAIVCPYSWTRHGGVQAQVRGLARTLRSDGHEVRVVAPAEGPVEAGVVPVGRSIAIPDNGSRVPITLSPAAGARAVAAATAGGIDVVHVHEPMIPAVSLAVLLRAATPLVGTFHRYADAPGWYRRFAPLCRRAVGRLDVRIAVSRAARDHVAATCPGDYDVVPLGLDVPPPPAGHRDGAGPGRIVFVGRPDRRKGLGVLLDAFARMPGRPALDLVGVDPADVDAAAGRGLPRERVRAHGRVPDERRDALLAAADVLCSPALEGESFGLVLAEAMAAGLPVVTTRVGGHAEVVTPETGHLVPPGDAAATAQALHRLLSDPEDLRRRSAAARRRAEALAWPGVARRHLELYETACRRRAGRVSAGRTAGRSAATRSRPAAWAPPPR